MYKFKRVLFIIVNAVLLVLSIIMLTNVSDLYVELFTGNFELNSLSNIRELVLLLIFFFGPFIFINAIFLNIFTLRNKLNTNKDQGLENNLLLVYNSKKYPKWLLSNYVYLFGNVFICILSIVILYQILSQDSYEFNFDEEISSLVSFILPSIFSILMIFDSVSLSKKLNQQKN